MYGDAKIPVPSGFFVIPMVVTPGDSATECLSRDANAKYGDCDIQVGSFQGVGSISVDSDGAVNGDPQYCPPSADSTKVLTGYDSFSVQGRHRAAEWPNGDHLHRRHDRHLRPHPMNDYFRTTALAVEPTPRGAIIGALTSMPS